MFEVHFLVRELWVRVKYSLEISVTQLVTIFELAILFMLLLYCIISEVNELVFNIIQVVVHTRCSEVAIFKEVSFILPVQTRQQTINSNVKLAFVNQERVVNILLNYVCSP